MTDLTFIEDGNSNLLEGGLINFVKRRRLAAVLKDIQQYQFKPYCLEEVVFIKEYLLKYEALDEDQCYKLSLQRETRSSDEKSKRSSIFSFGGKKKDEGSKTSSTGNLRASQKVNQKPSEMEQAEEEEEFEIEYRQGYKFYDKDSDNNIILEKDPDNPDRSVIIAGTLPKLVERLTYEKYPGNVLN